MFVAVDQFGSKVNPIVTAEEELRILSRSKMIFCPECKSVVRFASGKQVTAHFKHVHSPDCTYDSEPETEEHLRGKVLIRNWLVERYSDVRVEFEYKIKETNQRADVMAIFSGGKKIAFEMQCSKIQGSVWKERHALYKEAGIQDFWILGQSVHKYAKTNGEEDTEKHQLVSLASTIYDNKGVVLFLDTDEERLRGLYKHKFKGWHSDTILKFEEEIYPLREGKLYKNYIGTDSIKEDFKLWFLEEQRKEQLQKEQEEKYLREQEKSEREYAEFINLREKKMEQHLSDLNSITLASIKEKMTKNEKEVFERLLKKHGFNDDNFPGVFNVFTPNNSLIHTPHQLWQLWIYDKYIFRKNKPYDKVWIPKIKDEVYKMHRSGVFRLKYKSGDQHFSFALYDYFETLNSLEIVQQLGLSTTKYHQIHANVLPPLKGKEIHNYIAYYLSTELTPFIIDTELAQDIREAVSLYKAMIKEYKKDRLKFDEKQQPTILEYTNNLLKSKPELGNDWERDFISKMVSLQRNGYSLSDKQQNRVQSIVRRIEKGLGISLIFNNQ
ncbi:competence protein CoiA [Bacillus alkalicellulosilyticus]|uniref:competence protein CoiA n=1 Tax=Alkalihalobacterium alkalicellulosilyticum TaxID=1912214 RepID=UPI0009963A0A|nr:competence protein CoiA family protein [Bacillus alkalicellulosilyticus]